MANPGRKETWRNRRELLPMLRQWYGRERGNAEMIAHSPQPVSAAEVMKELCDSLVDRDVAHFILLETRWKEIMSGKLATFTRPARFRDGVLYIEVRHSALIRELTPSVDLFLDRINHMLGKGQCTEIRFVPHGSLSR